MIFGVSVDVNDLLPRVSAGLTIEIRFWAKKMVFFAFFAFTAAMLGLFVMLELPLLK